MSLSHLFPHSTYDVLKRESEACGFFDPDLLYRLIVAKAASSSREDLDAVYGAEEGLGSRLREQFRYAANWDGLIWVLKSKRYTKTRIQRVLIHTLTGMTKEMVHEARPYIRVLALNDRGAAHLKALKKSGKELDPAGPTDTAGSAVTAGWGSFGSGLALPVIENIKADLKRYPAVRDTFGMEILATDLYNAALGRDLYTNSEYVKKPLKF